MKISKKLVLAAALSLGIMGPEKATAPTPEKEKPQIAAPIGAISTTTRESIKQIPSSHASNLVSRSERIENIQSEWAQSRENFRAAKKSFQKLWPKKPKSESSSLN